MLRRQIPDFDDIADHVRNLAVRRSFEIWERLSRADILRGLVLQSPFGLECQPPRLRHAQIDRPGSAV